MTVKRKKSEHAEVLTAGSSVGDPRDAGRVDSPEYLTTNQGLRVHTDQHSLKAGVRGPSLLEDFHLREKITHFDHERIPERIVHARGSAAHGHFRVYESMKRYTSAKFLQYRHLKTIGLASEAVRLLDGQVIAHENDANTTGIVVATGRSIGDLEALEFVRAVAKHRHWKRAVAPQLDA